MGTLLLKCILFFLPVLVSCKHDPWLYGGPDNFLSCLSYQSQPDNLSENVVHNFLSPKYAPILESRMRNLRFNSSETPKPYYIVTPQSVNHISATILCCKKLNLEMRIRGGGHDYEGLSYVSRNPYVVLDMSNIRDIDVDVNNKTAWVGGGATLGELYYAISQKSLTLGFTSGVCRTVGVGGHFSGGGQGMLIRKYGLSVDNIIDAIIVDAEGRVFDRESMGEDLFWAIRGGGASSFGVVFKYKIRLVDVPPIVTAFVVTRTQEDGANRLIFRWQRFIDEVSRDLWMRVIVVPAKNAFGKPIIKALFQALYLGRKNDALKLMDEKFPELTVKETDCKEMTWINSTLFYDFFEKNETVKDLVNLTRYSSGFFKGKSDYVTLPIPEDSLQAFWDNVFLQGTIIGSLLMQPYGGIVSDIPSNQTAFPHRAGTLYNIHYLTLWRDDNNETEIKEHLDWIYKVYDYMGTFVSKPRTAYLNYRDLDLGKNDYVNDNYHEARHWGHMYYKDNFERLVQIKQSVDPQNFFRHEQSIPPLKETYFA